MVQSIPAVCRRLCVATVVTTLAAGPALAASSHGASHYQTRSVRGEVHGNVDQWGMLGAGGRVEFSIVPDGLISGGVDDELALSFGADVLFGELYPGWYGGGAYVVPIAAMQWNFYLNEHWSVFPEVGLAFHLGFYDDPWHDHHWAYVAPDLGVGARYHFNERNALLLRASTPGGLQVGITF